MPVDEQKLRDVLKNQGTFREKIQKEIGTYEEIQKSAQLEHGILTYLNEAAYGEMKAFTKDIGINKDTVDFYSFNDYQKLKD